MLLHVVARFSNISGVDRGSAREVWAVKTTTKTSRKCFAGRSGYVEPVEDKGRIKCGRLQLNPWVGCVVYSSQSFSIARWMLSARHKYCLQFFVWCLPLGILLCVLSVARFPTRFYGDVTFTDNVLLSISNDGGTVR